MNICALFTNLKSHSELKYLTFFSVAWLPKLKSKVCVPIPNGIVYKTYIVMLLSFFRYIYILFAHFRGRLWLFSSEKMQWNGWNNNLI